VDVFVADLSSQSEVRRLADRHRVVRGQAHGLRLAHRPGACCAGAGTPRGLPV